MKKVFIDGSAGTTGLRIHERLGERKDLSIITLSDDKRKDPAYRKEALNKADVAFLCLPDVAAIEAVSLLDNPDTVVIDTSTAHRTNPDWIYGFPEILGFRENIQKSKRIANPGCHASGFVSLIAPLIENKLLNPDVHLTCFSLTGYSGGGKKMIAEYESADRSFLYDGPRMYALGQMHKHLPEMQKVCGLENSPIFSPIVAPFYSGMEVSVPLFGSDLNVSMEELVKFYGDYYQNGLVKLISENDEEGFLSSSAFTGKDNMAISVTGNSERMVLVSRFDNLGKGASGAAIQNMNIILGVPENTGLST